jgi:gas vesicle protein
MRSILKFDWQVADGILLGRATRRIMDKGGFSSFLLGLGVGVGIGLLFAPKSGEETRKLIKSKAGEGGDYLKQRSAELKQDAATWVDKGKEAVARQKDSLADAVEAGRQAYRDSVDQASAPEGLAH